MNAHTFQLTLSDTEILTLVVDMTKMPATFAAYPIDLAAKYPKEYNQWLMEVVLPALTEAADEEMKQWFATKGIERLI